MQKMQAPKSAYSPQKRLFRTTFLFSMAATCTALMAIPAHGADQATGTQSTTDYQVIAQKLDAAQNGLSPQTGSSVYNFDQSNINNLARGQDSKLSDVLLQAPGVVQDSYGQLHVRGDHGDLQYRINGIILPEGISGFGQTLDTHFADNIDLLTGALPAEYGYRTAGVVNINTKNGAQGNGGRSAVTVGTNQTLEANQQLYGGKGPFNYYFNSTYGQNNRGIEPPTSAANPQHDDTTQDNEFLYTSYVLNPLNRLSFIFGNATNRFQIPTNPGQDPQYMLQGTPNYPSSNIDENQFEHNTYGIAALQGMLSGRTDYQLAVFMRHSSVLFKPDEQGDLIYNGISSRDRQSSLTTGIQNDFTHRLDSAHTLRFGWQGSYEAADSDSTSDVFSTTGPDCTTTPCTPENIVDNHSKRATLLSAYLQDEWKLTQKLTVNYGARFDQYDAYVDENQISPRIGMVYQATPSTKVHAGYARYFTPPPTELIAPETISAFANTTAAPDIAQASNVRPERDNYFDAGVIQNVNDNLTVGLDAYYKQARHLLDEGQFGAALIYAPFNYEKGYVRGVELSANYRKDNLSAYANVAVSQAMGKGVESGEYNFDTTEYDYINSNYVHLDHDQLYTGSAGAAYTYKKVKYSTDVLFGSGLRSGFANSSHLPFYTQVNAAVEKTVNFGNAGPFGIRLSAINLFDKKYEIRDGSGIGVFAPQYGPRRGFYLTLSKSF